MRARVFGGQQDGLGKQASRQDRTGQAGKDGHDERWAARIDFVACSNDVS